MSPQGYAIGGGIVGGAMQGQTIGTVMIGSTKQLAGQIGGAM